MRILPDIVTTARPKQWTKNAACLAPLVFSGLLLDWRFVLPAVMGTVSFIFVSAGTYTLNDVFDRERDRLHPRKRNRPVASGSLGIRHAVGAGLFWAIAGLTLSGLISTRHLAAVSAYVLLNVVYIAIARHRQLMDIMFISFGFLLRIQSGVWAIGVSSSAWILLCVFFVTQFLGAGKRYAELISKTDGEGGARTSLSHYSPPLLLGMMDITAAMTIATYSIYTVLGRGDASLAITVPIVTYGIFRYRLLIFERGGGQEPDDLLLTDVELLGTVLLWVAACTVLIYTSVDLFPS